MYEECAHERGLEQRGTTGGPREECVLGSAGPWSRLGVGARCGNVSSHSTC